MRAGVDVVVLDKLTYSGNRANLPDTVEFHHGDIAEPDDVAHTILELTGADPSLLRRVDDRPGHDRRYSLDSARLRALGWAPETTFDAGMRATVEWYRDNRAWWEPIKSGEFREYYERQYGARLSTSAPA